MKKRSQLRYFFVLTVLALGCLFLSNSITAAQKMSHTVEQGDTLWNICDKYYGDPDLWPKLWQMNPFVTNPHLLNPGDRITLLEKESVKVATVQVPEKTVPVKATEIEPSEKGFSVKGITDVRTLGYLSLMKPETWGRIFASESSQIIFCKGDTLFLTVAKEKGIKIGDEFAIAKPSPLIKHPVSGKKLGYAYAIHGRLVIEESTGFLYSKSTGELKDKDNIFKARIIEAFTPISIDDVIVPYKPVSPCILPVPMNREFLGNIVAAKNQHILISQTSIVYIDKGFNQGVKRGNLLEVVKINLVPNPDPKEKTKSVDDWHSHNTIILPDIPIGRLLVLESRPDTSTALVITAAQSFSSGVYIKDLSWDETPDFLSSMTRCPIE
ncbi:MAG: LysM peptidoglycan-binding domain-containing protein [Deltaproteobacteria bacterium]|nr:LysM peptidoglycan-binding domain-containing protein [Deltaproteobacteria bacterium]